MQICSWASSPFEDLISPVKNALRVKVLSLENDLVYGLRSLRALPAKKIANLHPADVREGSFILALSPFL